jgi:hypothetical protein
MLRVDGPLGAMPCAADGVFIESEGCGTPLRILCEKEKPSATHTYLRVCYFPTSKGVEFLSLPDVLADEFHERGVPLPRSLGGAAANVL